MNEASPTGEAQADRGAPRAQGFPLKPRRNDEPRRASVQEIHERRLLLHEVDVRPAAVEQHACLDGEVGFVDIEDLDAIGRQAQPEQRRQREHG